MPYTCMAKKVTTPVHYSSPPRETPLDTKRFRHGYPGQVVTISRAKQRHLSLPARYVLVTNCFPSNSGEPLHITPLVSAQHKYVRLRYQQPPHGLHAKRSREGKPQTHKQPSFFFLS